MPSYVNRYVPETTQVKALTGKVDIGVVTVLAQSAVNTTTVINGASVGDYVIATPTVDFSAIGRIVYFAFVSANNTVTIKYSNPSATAETATATTFNIMVIKNGVSL